MDKVIINSSTMTSIADAIRESTGKSDIMAPSEMPAKIKSILPADVKFGEFTPTADVNTFKAAHGLGVIPYAVFIWKADMALNNKSVRIAVSVNGATEYYDEAGREVVAYGSARGVRDNEEYYITAVSTQSGGDDGYGDTDTHFFAPVSNGAYFLAGETYKWMAVGR